MALLPPREREALLGDATLEELTALEKDWRFWARPKQLAPDGDWSVWVLRCGRGFGKTRALAGWVHERAMEEPGRWIALVAKTPGDARDHLIESPGGILRNAPAGGLPVYEPSKKRLTWPNGSYATVYSDERPDQLRGFSGDSACLDEFAKWKNARESWEMLQFGMREASADRPRIVIGTTPRPLSILKEIEARPSTVVVTGSSYENRSNLDPTWFDEALASYEGTRLGRQEIHAELLEDVPGALWTRSRLEELRLAEAPDTDIARIVVGVDPAVTSGEEADMTGIVVCAKGRDKRGYVLEDATIRASPEQWARRVVEAYRRWEADRIICEVNQGGDLVETVLRVVDRSVPIRKVHAARGKRVRAEPIAALYEKGDVHHVGMFPDLEDEMCTYVPGETTESPDRMDALVWALSDLMLKPEKKFRFA